MQSLHRTAIAEQRERYADACFRLIRQKRGVLHCVCVDPNGFPVRSTWTSRTETLEFVGLFGQLITRVRASLRALLPKGGGSGGGGGRNVSNAVADADAEADEVGLTSLRIRTHKHEVLITLDLHHVFFVVQAPSES